MTSVAAQDGSSNAVIVDTTGSMRLQFDGELSLANELVTQFKANTRMSLVRFDKSGGGKNATPKALISCSDDRLAVKKEIGALYLDGGQTTLWDAVALSAKVIGKETKGCDSSKERNIFIISDGEDRASAVKIDDLLKQLKADQVKVYAIGLLDELSDEKGLGGVSPRKTAQDALERITKETGGKVVFPKKKDRQRI